VAFWATAFFRPVSLFCHSISIGLATNID
jgi:hypothetical protein